MICTIKLRSAHTFWVEPRRVEAVMVVRISQLIMSMNIAKLLLIGIYIYRKIIFSSRSKPLGLPHPPHQYSYAKSVASWLVA